MSPVMDIVQSRAETASATTPLLHHQYPTVHYHDRVNMFHVKHEIRQAIFVAVRLPILYSGLSEDTPNTILFIRSVAAPPHQRQRYSNRGMDTALTIINDASLDIGDICTTDGHTMQNKPRVYRCMQARTAFPRVRHSS